MIEKTHDGRHGPDCFGCRIQNVQLTPSATPSRNADKFVYRPPTEPSWEKGIAGEHRPGGGFMPILKPGTTTPMGVKEYSENKRAIDAQIKRQRQPHPT